MRSATRLGVDADSAGRTRTVELFAEAPQLVRVTDAGGPGLPLVAHLCGGAAGPLGGDRSTFAVRVGAGARLTVRSVAATLAHPGPRGEPSTACLQATVGAGAHLDWWPEPLIAVEGCDHTVSSGIEVAGGGHLRWVDAVVAGRAGEAGGRVRLRQRVTWVGRVIAHHDVTIGAEPAGAGASRVAVTAIEIGGPALGATDPIVTASVRAARFSPEPGVVMWIGLGESLEPVRAALAALCVTP